MSRESRQKWLNLEDESAQRFLKFYTKEQILRIYRRSLYDDAETDTFIRAEAKKVLDNSLVDGDNWGVPPIENIVEMLVKEIIELRERIEKMENDAENNRFERDIND